MHYIFWMLVKGINQRKHYSGANSFNARLNVFVSICSVGRKGLWQLSQKKPQSNHHKISLMLTRVRSLKRSWYPSHNIVPLLQERIMVGFCCWLLSFFFFPKTTTLIILIYFRNENTYLNNPICNIQDSV